MAIKSFRHKGLEAFFYDGSTKGIDHQHASKLATRLDRLDAATSPTDMRLPGYRLHALKGSLQGRYAIDVSSAWRLTFAFDDDNAVDVDYEQYH